MYEITIPTTKPIELLPIGDIHGGHINCDYAALDRVRKYLSRSKYRRWFGMGDYIETVLPTHSPPGAIWTQDMDPGEQIDWFVNYWGESHTPTIHHTTTPEFLIKGNHEDRIYKVTGILPVKLMARELGCLYAHNGGYVKINVGEQSYLFYVRHGYGSSQTVHYHLDLVVKKRRVRADVVAIGHMHRLHHQLYDCDLPDGRVHTIHGIRTGGFLRTPDYAEERLYELAQIGCPIIKLWPNKYKIRIDIDTRVP